MRGKEVSYHHQNFEFNIFSFLVVNTFHTGVNKKNMNLQNKCLYSVFSLQVSKSLCQQSKENRVFKLSAKDSSPQSHNFATCCRKP